MYKQRRTFMAIILSLLMTLFFSGAVMAFSDMSKGPDNDKIMELQRQGIVNGVGNDKFAPNERLTYAQAVQIIVKGLDLNIDHIKFIKKPEASDSFDHVPNDAWYAKSFIIAALNGLPLQRAVDPEKTISREAYANLLAEAMWTKGDYAFIDIWVMIEDESDIDKANMTNIQKLLIAHIAKLDDQRRFLPKQEITRAEAAVMLYNARKFVAEQTPLPQKPDDPAKEDKVTLTIDTVNNDVSKVTLSWGMKPNPGYRLTIDRIDFAQDGKAVIYYTLHNPEPNMAYPAVIAEPKAVTYFSSKLKPEIKQLK